MRTLDIFKSRIMRAIFWAAVIGLALNAVRLHEADLRAELLPAKVVPYTVVLQDYTVGRDGTTVPSFRLTVAVRSDGSRSMESTNSAAPTPFSERILQFSSGTKMHILQHLKLKSTTFDPAKAIPSRWLPDPTNSCLFSGSPRHEQLAGEEVVEGYRTARVTDGPTTHWLALDYGCALIKDRADWQDGQKSEKKLIALIPGEPAPSMFDDPAEFQEVPPSHLLTRNASAADAYYGSHRPPNGTPAAQ